MISKIIRRKMPRVRAQYTQNKTFENPTVPQYSSKYLPEELALSHRLYNRNDVDGGCNTLQALTLDISAFFNFVAHIVTHNVRDKSLNEEA